MNDVSPELLTLGITHDSSLALVLYLCWFIIMPDVKYVGALPFIILNMCNSFKKYLIASDNYGVSLFSFALLGDFET